MWFFNTDKDKDLTEADRKIRDIINDPKSYQVDEQQMEDDIQQLEQDKASKHWTSHNNNNSNKKKK